MGIVVGQRCAGCTGCAASGPLEAGCAGHPVGGELSGVDVGTAIGVTGADPVADGHAGTVGPGGRS